MKPAIKYVVKLSEVTTYHYYGFLEEFGYNFLPDYFTEERKEIVKLVRENEEYRNTTRVNLQEVVGTTIRIPGMELHSFDPFTKSESIH